MELDREIPFIRSGEKLLTRAEAESALEHAAAFIRLAESLDAGRFGESAQQWLEKYNPKP